MLDPANSIYVAYALETGSVAESADNIARPTKAAVPSTFTVCGMLSNTPDMQRGLNNAFGWAVGSSEAVYKKRGARNPEMSLPLKITNIGLLALGIRDPVTRELPRLAFAFGRPGQWTYLVRDCKINTFSLSAKQNTTGEAQELEAQISIMACYQQLLATPFNPDARALLLSLGDPYFWHDTRSFGIADNSTTPVITDYSATMTAWSISVNNSLSRHGLRRNFGDDCELSNTNTLLKEGNSVITGDIDFDGRLQEALLTGAKESQNWGDISMLVSNAPAVVSGGKGIAVTMGRCMPQTANMPGVEPSAQIASKIPFMAQTLAIVDAS